MSKLTKLTETFTAAQAGNPLAAAELLPLLYEELRKLGKSMMRQQPAGHTLQATALVHEAYAKVVGTTDPGWDGRGHFFGAAAQAMREILVDQARRRGALKRGGDQKRQDLAEFDLLVESPIENIVALDEVLKKLEQQDPQKAQIVNLRFFAGFNMQEISSHLKTSKSTIEREWRFIRAWLYKELDAIKCD